MESPNQQQNPKKTNQSNWIPLSHSIMFLLRHKSLLGWSSILVLITIILTYIGFQLSVHYIEILTGDFFLTAPEKIGALGWVKYSGWLVSKYLFAFFSHVVSFYLAFLLAFSLTTPGYVFLSKATENKQIGISNDNNTLSIKSVLIDLFEGIKIGAFGILVAIAAIIVSFIPLVGQILVFLMYTYYSALMFLDYPTSQRGWSLGAKMNWLREHNTISFRIGFLPALVSMIPILNIFLIALLFPVLTVHTTLNFNRIETSRVLRQ